jgi:hypothetical protein
MARIEEIVYTRNRAKFLINMVTSIASVTDPVRSLSDTNHCLAPWRRTLPPEYFRNTLAVMPESYPSSWTQEYAAKFLEGVLAALAQDMFALDSTMEQLKCRD